MKKILMMALSAFVVMSCAKESNVNGGNDGAVGGKTHAYFSFKLDGGSKLTRAAADYDHELGAADAMETNDALFAPGDLKMLIFNATTRALEHKVDVTATSMTMVLTAGPKKIYVFANTSKLADEPTASGDDFTTRFGALTEGTSTLNDLYNKAFSYSAGTPQANISLTDKGTDARTFSLENLSTRVLNGTNGLPMSSSDETTYTLAPNVSEADAQAGPANKIEIKISYMLAKARMAMAAGVIGTQADGATSITVPKFAVKNLATKTNYVQKWGTGGAESYYHNDFSGSTPVADYLLHFDRASNANVAIVAAGSDYVYVPENTSKLLYRGQSSYYAVNVTYEPGFIATSVAHDLTDVFAFGGFKAYSVIGVNTYIYVHTNIVLDKAIIPAGTYITSEDIFKAALWIAENDAAWGNTGAQQTEAATLLASAAVKDNYDVFTDAQSWYRLDMGEGTGAATKYGVLRGNKYTATINNISGPGKPNEKDLDDDSDKPVVSNTYIALTITAVNWVPVSQGGDLQ